MPDRATSLLRMNGLQNRNGVVQVSFFHRHRQAVRRGALHEPARPAWSWPGMD